MELRLKYPAKKGEKKQVKLIYKYQKKKKKKKIDYRQQATRMIKESQTKSHMVSTWRQI